MKQYMTVKEVCQLTGLTRKHLYYFHHENVVRAVAHANYSVKGNDGYKLYDQQAVEKLQQIALFYLLNLKRNEIRDMMLEPEYNFNTALDMMIVRAKEKRSLIDRQIAMLENLKNTGASTDLSPELINTLLDQFTEESKKNRRK